MLQKIPNSYSHALTLQMSKQKWSISIISGQVLPSRPYAVLPAFMSDYHYFLALSPFQSDEISLHYRYSIAILLRNLYTVVSSGREFTARTTVRILYVPFVLVSFVGKFKQTASTQKHSLCFVEETSEMMLIITLNATSGQLTYPYNMHIFILHLCPDNIIIQ